MKVSAFTLTTNTTKFGYPFIESIKSWLPAVDELVVIDGGSTDGTVEMIQAIGDPKIRIIQDEDTKWEENWSYSRLGHNFNRGFHECTGDVIFKFDTDYVLHHEAYESTDERKNLRAVCARALQDNSLVITFCRQNLVLVDRYFWKKHKTLAVNVEGCKKRNIPVDYGLQLERWSWGYEPIVSDKEMYGIKHGVLLNSSGNGLVSDLKIFNYGFVFSTKEQVDWVRRRHILAENIQKNLQYKNDPGYILAEETEISRDVLAEHTNICVDILKGKSQTTLNLEDHPKVMWDKIKSLKPEQLGYNVWGNVPNAKYYA